MESVCKLHFKSVKFKVTTVYMEILIKTQLGWLRVLNLTLKIQVFNCHLGNGNHSGVGYHPGKLGQFVVHKYSVNVS